MSESLNNLLGFLIIPTNKFLILQQDYYTLQIIYQINYFCNTNILENVSNGKLEVSDAKEDLSEVFETYEEICSEIGMKLGARMLFQLLSEDGNPEANNIYE